MRAVAPDRLEGTMSEPEPPSGDGAGGYNLAYLHVPGVRFNPTDQELIVDYLQRKLRGEPPLYADAVNDDGIDVYSEHPKDLVLKLRKGFVGTWYMFSPRIRKYGNGDRPRRGTDDGLGFWKSTGAKEKVLGADGNKEVIGHRCGLTYHVFLNKPGDEAKPAAKRARSPTEWKMVEFISINTNRPPDKTAKKPMLLNDYVLCKITNKKFPRVEEDPGLSQSTEEEEEEEQGAPSDGSGASQDPQQQSTPSEGLPGPQDEQQQDAPIEGNTEAAAALLQQAEPGDFAFGANANTLDDDDDDSVWGDSGSLNFLTGYVSNTGMPSIYDCLGDYMETVVAGESKHEEEQQQATTETKNKAATAAVDADSVSPDTVAVPSNYDWEAWPNADRL